MLPPDDLPTLKRRVVEAKRAIYAKATPEEIAEDDAWQKEFRRGGVARRKRGAEQRKARVAFQRDVVERAFRGEPTRAIAAAHKVPLAKIEVALSILGVPRRHKSKPCRTPPLDLRESTMLALERWAADRSMTLEAALEAALEILGEDGARALRRLHHMQSEK